ncbi:MAG: AMP-binding enzyme [Rhodobacterales bacterium]
MRLAARNDRRVADWDVKVVDAQGNPVAPDTKGEILARGLLLFRGYTDAAATQEVLRINRGGLKIASAAVENVLYRHPDVLEAAVVAVPHPDLGEDIAAMVVAREGVAGAALARALRDLCRSALADYDVPRHILFRDSLPRNPIGKILKADLHRDAQGAVAAQRLPYAAQHSDAKDSP